MANVPTGVTPEMLDYLLSNPGEVVSNTEVRTPQAHVDINNRADKGVRPQIGGHSAGKDRINTPSPNLAKRLTQGFDEQQAELAEEAERLEEAKAMSPEALNSRVAYLERTLKKVQSQLRKLEKTTDG